jgi:hypothetical protein
MNARLVPALAAATFLGIAAGPALAATCSTVVATGSITPDAFGIARRLPGTPAINGAGDVLFVARPRGTKPRIYLYPAVGAPSLVVAADALAPNGSLFRSFDAPSLDDAGDLAFFAIMTVGQGVFLRESGNPLEVAGITTGTSPGGGVLATFPAVSAVNPSRQVAFTATVNGGPNGVFRYDGVANTASSVALAGWGAGGGRIFCDFSTVALGASSAVAFRATTKVNCADAMELPRDGVFVDIAGVLHTVALQGDPTPIPGTTYASFSGAPALNGADHVSFQTVLAGVLGVGAVFRFDPVAMSTVKVVTTGEAAPSGGFIGRIDVQRLDGSDDVFLKAGVSATLQRAGIFRYDAMPDAVLLNTAAPPTDLFAPGAAFRTFSALGITPSGSRFALVARVKDLVPPRSKVGLLRCVP